jgi:hypothetical protein
MDMVAERHAPPGRVKQIGPVFFWTEEVAPQSPPI